jgi:signal transduction histidine kinase
MRIRAGSWPGLRARGIWLEVALALLGGAAVVVDAIDQAVLLPGAVALAAVMLLFRRSHPVVPFAVSSVLAAASTPAFVAEALTAYAVGRYAGSWPVRLAVPAAGALLVMRPWRLHTFSEWVGALGTAGLVVVLPGALGLWQRTRALLLASLRERAERAEAERELMARDAVLTERTRIAREMHDVVGHRVSLMVLQAGAIEMAAADRERVEQLAWQVQTAGRQALDELRQLLGVLRAGDTDQAAPLAPQPGLADLPRLAAQAREAGMIVELAGPPQPCAAVDPLVGRAAYRIVQEALTNAGKHAPGAPVTVTIERPAGALVVRVVNGPPSRSPEEMPGGGFGLIGLGERVRTLGGKLTAQPRLDGGFAVEAVLPT